MHKHKCDSCGHIWEHKQDHNWTTEQFNAAHTCTCGERQTWKFYGEGHPGNVPQAKREALMEFINAMNALLRVR